MGVRALLTLGLIMLCGPCCAQQPQGFIRVANGRFVDDDCREYLFAGWNGWGMLDAAVSNPGAITARFSAARAASLSIARFFLTGEQSSAQLLSGPGELDERGARGLDWVVSEAERFGIRLTLAWTNLWKDDGVPRFEQWCGTSGINIRPRPDQDLRPPGPLNASERVATPYAWLTSAQCREQFKQFMTALVNRRNTITGRLYRDEPTIFSWNLMNEPRCKYCGPEAVDGWYADMAAHLKGIDPNHLVSLGEEGFFSEADPMAELYNPNDGNMWGPRSGQDFRANHAHAAVDYSLLLVIHLWPHNWRQPPLGTDFGRAWIQSHAAVAAQLGKPLVLEEFGKGAAQGNITAVRDPWFLLVNEEVQTSLEGGGPLRGSLFWQWDGETGPRTSIGSTVRQTDSTFKDIIEPFARDLASRTGALVPGCAPRTSASSSGLADGTGAADGPADVQAAGRRLLRWA